MKKIICAIGISFISEEKPYIAMGQIGHKIQRIIDEDLTAFQYSAEDEEELKEKLIDFITNKINSYLEIKRVREAEDNEEHIVDPKFANNLEANKNGIYHTKDILRKREDT
jgi:beta-glucosidase/6-phospho-beta-glucosidase/beta-galactosidase